MVRFVLTNHDMYILALEVHLLLVKLGPGVALFLWWEVSGFPILLV